MVQSWCLPGCIAAALLLTGTGHAQTVSPPGTADAPAGALLRTYVNLVQVPVLVLRSDRSAMPPLDTSHFRVRLDSGPPFAPRHVRREGADPIRLVLLVEQNNADQLLKELPGALARLDETVLLPQDRVSISVVTGCAVVSSQPMVASPGRLQGVATQVLRQAAEYRPAALEGSKNCTRKVHLWDSLASAMVKIKNDSGRRLIFAFTDGADEGSRLTPVQAQELAAATGVTVIGVRRDDIAQRGYVDVRPGGPMYSGVYRPESDPFSTLCEISGGLVLEGHTRDLGEELVQAVALVRDRYIVDFGRPTSLGSGMHSIDVTIGRNAFVRVGGTTVPLPDPAETNDPARVPQDPASEPPVGTRRILKH